MEEKTLLRASLVFPCRGEEILGAFKVGKIGDGCWNGFGGGLEGSETIEQCGIRELEEEIGMSGRLEDLTKIAVVDFHNTKTDGTVFVCRVHTFLLHNPTGIPRISKEMINPSWCKMDKLPVDKMMPGDRFWLPPALAGEKIYAKVYYGPFQKQLLQPVEIYPLAELVE